MSEQAPSGLSPTLAVRVDGDTVRLVLQITNAGAEPVELEFSSGQRFDFEVRDAAGEVVWLWSADRMFAQMLGSELLATGGTLRWDATWAHGGRQGRFEAAGRLTSLTHPIELRTPFELPPR